MKDLTVNLADEPGTLAQLGEALGNAGINIEGISAFTEDKTINLPAGWEPPAS